MQIAGAVAWVAWVVVVAVFFVLFWRARRRRKHIGGAAAGTLFEMLNEDKRKAVELIVEHKTAEKDPERATGRPGDD